MKHDQNIYNKINIDAFTSNKTHTRMDIYIYINAWFEAISWSCAGVCGCVEVLCCIRYYLIVAQERESTSQKKNEFIYIMNIYKVQNISTRSLEQVDERQDVFIIFMKIN